MATESFKLKYCKQLQPQYNTMKSSNYNNKLFNLVSVVHVND